MQNNINVGYIRCLFANDSMPGFTNKLPQKYAFIPIVNNQAPEFKYE